MSVSAGSLLKHCFYDKDLFEKYVKQGKGVGFLVLLIAAALTAVVFCVKVAWIFANIPESDISRFCEQFPEMTVSGGEIISETPIVQTLPALVPHILLAVDTKANEQDAVNFPAGVYLMKRALTIVDTNRQVQKIPLKNIFDSAPVSRSQAKRLCNRLEKFEEVILDFEGNSWMGQGFAHQMFVVFKNAHPSITIKPINMNESVENMYNHVLKSI